MTLQYPACEQAHLKMNSRRCSVIKARAGRPGCFWIGGRAGPALVPRGGTPVRGTSALAAGVARTAEPAAARRRCRGLHAPRPGQDGGSEGPGDGPEGGWGSCGAPGAFPQVLRGWGCPRGWGADRCGTGCVCGPRARRFGRAAVRWRGGRVPLSCPGAGGIAWSETELGLLPPLLQCPVPSFSFRELGKECFCFYQLC